MERVSHENIPAGVDSRIVERTIRSGFPWLKFPRRLEAAFEAEVGADRCRQLAIGALFGVVLYNLFLISDWLTAPDTFHIALWVRLGVVTPIALLLIATLYLNPPVGVRELIVAAGAVVLGAGSNLYLMLAAHGPHHDAQHQIIILILLFITMVQRIRFWYAVAACLACFAMHAVGLAMLPQYPLDFQVSANAVFGCAVVLAIFASYVLEREMRMNFLLSLRGRLQRRELDVESRRDPLTGLRNRRSLDEVIEVCNQNKGWNQELAIVLLDIDHFKAFNDTAGHQAGDVCLKRVAGIIQSELRDHVDTAFRFGGEEFILVLRGVDLSTAVRISERIRRAIEDAAIPHPALPIGDVVTVSMGVASAIVSREIRVGVIISAADSALYAAKRNGRNQVSPRPQPSDVVDMQDRKLRLM
ncbi:diguanylate cyclase [Hyphomicrobium sp.]|uniref:GGDEF domain-containing protein n=1 Tax=Hyphomicrobium sp. TaxID=82 RepID=UPI002D793393|nr:diguanylate cyclase [Hyphomicrobium sp.]HET6389869.1 diguanylate cyclase [Hyphomicrobium sp.]